MTGAAVLRARTRSLAVATALLFVASLVGAVVVSRDDAPGTVLDLRAAAATTRQAGSGRLALRMAFTIGDRTIEATGEGAFSTDPTRSTLTIRSPLFPQPVEVVADGTTAYLRAFGPYQAAAQGKPWVAFDLGGFRPPVSLDPTATDPLQVLALLEAEGGVGDVRRHGTEDVRGVRTTRYTADVDVAEVMARANGSTDAAPRLDDLLDGMESELTLWVGDDGLVRRASVRIRGETDQPLTVTVTTELFDFGAPVAVVVPPSDQVTRLPSLSGG